MVIDNLRVVFLGPPGCGKGSQAVFVVKRHQIAHISTGELLRAAVNSGSQLGRQVSELMQQGSLVPDSTVVDLVAERLEQSDTANGFLLDGFPRSLQQARSLDRILAERDIPLSFVLLLNIENDAVIKRLSGRRNCPDCGRIYNIYFNPPKIPGHCDDCGQESSLIQRADDNEESIQHRLNVYETETTPLLNYYENAQMLRTVDASGSVEKIARSIEAMIQNEKDVAN